MSNALERGLDVLEMLGARGEARVSDLVDGLDVSRATVFRIMATLESRGFAENVPERHSWRLGRTLIDLAATSDSEDFANATAAAITELAAQTQETINLATVHRGRVVWSATVDSPHALRMTTTLGDPVSVHATAAGKAILAAMPHDDWMRLLPPGDLAQLTENTRTTLDALATDIEQCRTQGWALDEEECEVNGVCVAAAIVNSRGRPVAAISISSTTGRMTGDRRREWGTLVRDRCEQVTKDLAAPAV